MKKVSIITPTYNREKLLPRMVTSVINQSYDNWELIIVDDGSTDNTEQVVAGFSDERIRYFYTKNSGAADSRNAGVALASGELIIFLDSDDEAMQDWLEKLVSHMGSNEKAIVCCGYEHYNSKGEFVKVELPQNLGSHFDNVVGKFLSGTMLMPRNLFVQTGGYDETLPSGQHTELFMRLYPILINNKISIINIFEPLIKVHIHGGVRIRHNYDAIFLGSKGMLEKHELFFRRNRELHFDYLSMAAVSAFKTNRIDEGKKFLIRALKVNPLSYKPYARLLVGYTPLRNFVWK